MKIAGKKIGLSTQVFVAMIAGAIFGLVIGDIMVELSHLAERHFAKLLNLSFGRTPHNTYIISFRASFPPHGYESAQNAFCQELAGVSGMIRMENHIDHI